MVAPVQESQSKPILRLVLGDSDGLWSLKELIEVATDRVLKAYQGLNGLQGILNWELFLNGRYPITDNVKEAIVLHADVLSEYAKANALTEVCRHIELVKVAVVAQPERDSLKHPGDDREEQDNASYANRLYHDMRHLNAAFEEVISGRKLYQLAQKRADWFRNPAKFESAVWVKLPDLADDLSEGCDSYACEHFRAAQLLFYRVHETALRRLAKRLNVRIPRSPGGLAKTWDQLCDDVSKEIERRLHAPGKNAKTMRTLERLSAVNSYLSSVRIARNATMHPPTTGDPAFRRKKIEADTDSLVEATKTFLNELATVL